MRRNSVSRKKSTQDIVDACGEKEGGRTQAGGPAQSLLGRQKEWARHPESGRTGALRRRSMMLVGRFSIPIGRGAVGRSLPPPRQAIGRRSPRRERTRREENVPWESAWRWPTRARGVSEPSGDPWGPQLRY